MIKKWLLQGTARALIFSTILSLATPPIFAAGYACVVQYNNKMYSIACNGGDSCIMKDRQGRVFQITKFNADLLCMD